MNFLDFIKKNNFVILDGAMGTELERRGSPGGPRSNLINPEKVIEIHKDYINAGSHAIITNTFGMNRIYIQTHDLKIEVEEVNRKGVFLAKTAAQDKVFILGNISSTGQLLEPYGSYKEKDFYEAFKEQASYLLEEGVDGFIIETITDLREGIWALRACKDTSNLPTIVSMSFHTDKNGGRTIMGDSVRDCALQLSKEGADIIGTNCGELTPLEMANVVSIFKNMTSLPIIAEPNAGKPEIREGKTFYMNPENFAISTLECYKRGATLIGGCCGTTPEHIKILSSLILKESQS
ncbi:MAG: homocysteine S-methyltransferase family protein [candidate division WOR-3 bacterium]